PQAGEVGGDLYLLPAAAVRGREEVRRLDPGPPRVPRDGGEVGVAVQVDLDGCADGLEELGLVGDLRAGCGGPHREAGQLARDRALPDDQDGDLRRTAHPTQHRDVAHLDTRRDRVARDGELVERRRLRRLDLVVG